MKIWRAPLRLFPGAYILNSGVTKLRTNSRDAQQALHGMAKNAFPQFEAVEPDQFVKTLGAAETALGATLLAPFVPAALAGALLTGFASGLLWMYWKTPGMHEEGSIRPTQQGTAIAKDSWMLGIGLALLLSSLSRSGRSGPKVG
jgi:hypothetical protein